jgi:ribosome-associated translation inhibitor RaiA
LSKEPVAARQAYFMALREHWPELISSLKANVLPHYEPIWSDGDSDTRWGIYESWIKLQSDQTRKNLFNALQEWASRFRITEHWIMQTALDTVQCYSAYPNTALSLARPKGSESRWFWIYAPRSSYGSFKPSFESNFWHTGEVWPIFKKRMESQFKKQLKLYRQAVEARMGGTLEHLERDAEWTARYQKGQAVFELAGELRGYEDSEQTVYRAIERYAATIELNLRKNQKRRRPQLPYHNS